MSENLSENLLQKILNYDPILIKNIASDEVVKEAYLILKENFYNRNSSEWVTSRALNKIKILDVSIEKFIKLYEAISHRYHNTHKRGVKSNQIFIGKLKKIKEDKSGDKLTHFNHDKKHLLDSLEVLRNWKNDFLNITDEDFINFIHQKLDFPYSLKTLRRYYFDQTSKK